MVKNTLTVGRIEEGFVLDHIQAGRSMDIYKYLHLDKLDCCVAIIKNAKSNKMGKKDIMKIECPIDFMDLDILGFIDHNITVNIIKNSEIVDKKMLHLPHEIRNVIHCKNPRCITSIEQGLDHVFVLTDPEKEVFWEDLGPKVEVTRRLARKYADVYLPMNGILTNCLIEKVPTEDLSYDGVHLSDPGCAIMAREYLKAWASIEA